MLHPVSMVIMWAFFITVIISVIYKHGQFLFSYFFPCDLIKNLDFFPCVLIENSDENSVKARNLSLMLTALAAFPLAIHRTMVADEQLKATEEQIEQARKEVRERDFKEWQKDLFSGTKSQKYNAIEQLWKLAQNHTEDYHRKVMDSLSKLFKDGMIITGTNIFVVALKMLTNQDDQNKKTKRQKIEEIKNDYRIRLQGLQITKIDLRGADFSRFELKGVTFSEIWYFAGASFEFSDLLETKFENCDLSSAKFNWTMLSNTEFKGAILTKTDFIKTFLRDRKVYRRNRCRIFLQRYFYGRQQHLFKS